MTSPSGNYSNGIMASASAIFSMPSCNGFDTMPFAKKGISASIVSFIFEEVSVTGRICIQKLNDNGELSLSNFIVFGS